MLKVVRIKGIHEKKFKKFHLKVQSFVDVQVKETAPRFSTFFFFLHKTKANKQNSALVIDSVFDFCVFPGFSTTFFVNTSALTVALKY